ncbi:hypothetical protein [Deinococcus frigens]|uniref:hypothetical protein n=1 Tax=Deinococcus frigens TaxID=249403 RepID=UPI00049631CD|nr:hypothetical protein [Deinococcus frigens]
MIGGGKIPQDQLSSRSVYGSEALLAAVSFSEDPSGRPGVLMGIALDDRRREDEGFWTWNG